MFCQARTAASKRSREKSPNSVFSTPDKTFKPNEFSTNIKKTTANAESPEFIIQNPSIIHLTDATNFQNLATKSPQISRVNSSISITPSMHSFIVNSCGNTGENQASTIKPQQANISKMPSFQVPSGLGQIAFAMPQLSQLQQLQQLQQMHQLQQIQVLPQQQQQGLVIPAGFQGTIVFQPTIHMHSKNSYKDISNYRKIIPKGAGTPSKATPKK
jgi:hypothetical protein